QLLADRGDLDGALRAYQKAFTLNQDFALARYHLGAALEQKGRFAEALVVLQQGKRSRDDDPWSLSPEGGLIAACKHRMELEKKLPAVLRGQSQPADAAERCELARVCHAKQFYAASARLAEEAFVAKPQLAEDRWQRYRFRAACSAAQAAAGQG